MKHEFTAARIVRGVVTFAAFMVIMSYFGYAQALDNMLIVVIASVLCAFIPISASSLLLIVYLLIHLYALSPKIAAVTLALFVLSYILCAFYGARHTHNMIYFPLCYQMQFPYILPMISGLTGGINEVTSVLCGSVIAFFMAVIRRNSSAFLEGESGISVMELLLRNMFYNPLFYFFLLSMIAMFLVTYLLRERAIHNAWNIAVTAGVITEFVMMLIGYFATGNAGRIPQLIFWNVIVLVAGFLMGAFVSGLDYGHIEKVQFEDDEYYYYVTAVPKARIAEESRDIKHITEPGGKGRHTRTGRRKTGEHDR